MTIPLTAFLILYLIFVFIWLVFSIIALYHIIKYGQINFTTFLITFAYLAGAAMLLFFSYQFLNRIDWSASLAIFQKNADIFWR